MTLRNKVLILVVLTLITLLAVFYMATRYVIFSHLHRLEERLVRENVLRVFNALDNNLENLAGNVYDWAAWDDTYVYVRDRNPGYVKANLVDETFSGLQVNLFIMADTNRQIIAARHFDLETGSSIPVSEQILKDLKEYNLLRTPTNTTDSISGIICLAETPMLINTHPILTSKDKGPVRGVLLMGRYLDKNLVQRMGEITEVPLELFCLHHPALPADIYEARHAFNIRPMSQEIYARTLFVPVTQHRAYGYGLLSDIFGRTIALFRVTMPREIHRSGLHALHYVTAYTLACGSIFGLLILWIMEKFVLSRLSKLSDSVDHITRARDASQRIHLKGSDELALLGQDINHMLTALEAAYSELEHSEEKYRSFVQHFQGIAYRGNMNFSPIFCHGAVKEITGYSELELLKGTPRWDELIHPQDMPRLVKSSRKLRLIPEYSCERDYRILRKDGSIRWVHEIMQNMLDGDGEPQFVQGTLYDITNQKEAEEALIESRARLQRLSEHLQNIQERESTRIARRIHDDIGQLLMSLKIDVAWLQKHMASTAPIMQKKLAGMLRMIDQIADTIQHISQELRPSVLDALGLPEALEWQLSELKKRTGQRINLRILPENLVLDKETSTNLFRIIQEAVRNVARHAQATELSVSLEIKDDIVLAEVHDNGVGIPEETLHNIHAFGLSQMRERAESMGGKLTITSRPGYGTTVQLALPLRPIYEEEVPLS